VTPLSLLRSLLSRLRDVAVVETCVSGRPFLRKRREAVKPRLDQQSSVAFRVRGRNCVERRREGRNQRSGRGRREGWIERVAQREHIGWLAVRNVPCRVSSCLLRHSTNLPARRRGAPFKVCGSFVPTSVADRSTTVLHHFTFNIERNTSQSSSNVIWSWRLSIIHSSS
jgi:hypothetical protein